MSRLCRPACDLGMASMNLATACLGSPKVSGAPVPMAVEPQGQSSRVRRSLWDTPSPVKTVAAYGFDRRWGWRIELEQLGRLARVA